MSQTALPTTQVPGLYHRRAGDTLITAISDGHLQGAVQILKDITPEAAEAILTAEFRALPPTLSLNVFVLRHGDRTALVDAGGGAMAPSVGQMMPALAAAGIDPASIDTVLLTHMHRDHVYGLINPDGSKRFPNATIHAHGKEIDFWMNEANAGTVAASFANQFEAVRLSVVPYGDRVQRFSAGAELFPGVTTVDLPGHSPGHSGFRIGGNDGVLIWGDIMHMPEVQSRHPEASLVFDYDPAMAVATRQKMLDQAATDRLTVAGMHLHFSGFAHVGRRAGGGYAVVPEVWRSSL
jgi:glyoxylase-like metal-dependent hydrolase (beta-lactamase superfamily II)